MSRLGLGQAPAHENAVPTSGSGRNAQISQPQLPSCLAPFPNAAVMGEGGDGREPFGNDLDGQRQQRQQKWNQFDAVRRTRPITGYLASVLPAESRDAGQGGDHRRLLEPMSRSGKSPAKQHPLDGMLAIGLQPATGDAALRRQKHDLSSVVLWRISSMRPNPFQVACHPRAQAVALGPRCADWPRSSQAQGADPCCRYAPSKSCSGYHLLT